MKFSNDISYEYASSIMSYNPESGHIAWKSRNDIAPKCDARRKGKIAGCYSKKDKCIIIGINGKTYLSHRIAWLLHYGTWPKYILDHINCDRTDNRISNLRDATQAENLSNRGVTKRNTTGIKGVSFDKKNNRYFGRINSNRKSFYIGSWKTIEEAVEPMANAYNKIHGEFARLNDV